MPDGGVVLGYILASGAVLCFLGLVRSWRP